MLSPSSRARTPAFCGEPPHVAVPPRGDEGLVSLDVLIERDIRASDSDHVETQAPRLGLHTVRQPGRGRVVALACALADALAHTLALALVIGK